MAEDLLEGVHVPAILKVSRCEGMPEQMGADPGDAGLLLEFAEHLPEGAVRDRLQIRQEEHPVSTGTAGTAGKIPGKHLAGMQAKRDKPLFVALAVHDNISLGDMDMIQGEGSHLMKPQAAVQHKGNHAKVTELNQPGRVETGEQGSDLRK